MFSKILKQLLVIAVHARIIVRTEQESVSQLLGNVINPALSIHSHTWHTLGVGSEWTKTFNAATQTGTRAR